MRYLYLISSPPNAAPPPQRLMDEIDKLVRIEAGKSMIDGGSFAPQGKGARHASKGGKLIVSDGPFTETKEIIGGYAIFEFATEAEAIESARHFMQLHVDYGGDWEGTCHMYQMQSGIEPAA